jgi:alpha-galactosidase
MATKKPDAAIPGEVAAIARDIALDAAHPAPEWGRAATISFSSDWQGKNPDPGLETRVSLLWSPAALYVRFACRYREIYVFDDSDAGGRRDHLWDRDVAEVFLQPDPSHERYYKEFEVSPNGMWIDLDVGPGKLDNLKSGLQRSASVDEKNNMWTAELSIPLRALINEFNPAATWRANFYRIEGRNEPRKYLAWQATKTPEPNFHVPSAFGKLRFQPL